MMPFWDHLGVDEGGLPVHLPIGVTREGQGPTNDEDAHHVQCWCSDPDCPLNTALLWAYRLGASAPRKDEESAPALTASRWRWR